MFGLKKKKSVPDVTNSMLPPTARLTVIPEIFYGGTDPVIHFASQTSPPGASATAAKQPSRLANKKFLLLTGGGLLFLFLAGASWYYLWPYFSRPRAALPLPPVVVSPPLPPPQRPPTSTTTPPVFVTTTPNTVPPPTSTGAVPLTLGQFPDKTTVDAGDFDRDQLTDLEEDVFGIDPGLSDTDGDGYYDGLEVFNLYNPKGFAPVKIIDSGLVREYVNPTWHYRIYYPSAWQAADVDSAGDQVIFSSILGDFIEVQAFQKVAGQTFQNWFAATVVGQQFSDLTAVNNRFRISGWQRSDGLVAYYPTDTVVYALLYHPSTNEPIPFRHIMAMMIQSFRPGSVSIEIPPQIVLPPEGASSTAPSG